MRAANLYSLLYVGTRSDCSDTLSLFGTFVGLAHQLLESACGCEVSCSAATDLCSVCVCVCAHLWCVLLISDWCAADLLVCCLFVVCVLLICGLCAADLCLVCCRFVVGVGLNCGWRAADLCLVCR